MENEITADVKAEIIARTQTLAEQARSLIISNERENTEAVTLMGSIKKEIKARLESDLYVKTEAAKDAAKSAFDELKAMMITPLKEYVEIVNGKSGVFVKQEQSRRDELQRIENERVAKAQREADEKFRKAQAEAAEKGKVCKAVEPKIIPQRVYAAVSAPAGTTYRDYWSAQVVDIKALCAGVAAGTVDPSFVTGNGPALNKYAGIMKKEGIIMPGVTGIKTVGTSQRS